MEVVTRSNGCLALQRGDHRRLRAEAFRIQAWWRTEQTPVFAIELRRAVIADEVAYARDVSGTGDHQ